MSSSDVGSIAALTVGAIVAVAVAGVGPTEPSGPPQAEPASTFDVEIAKATLEATHYLNCGPGGVAELSVTFGASGIVERVSVDTGALREDVARCVAGRFAGAVVPAFLGPPRTLRCRIRLES